MPQKTVSSGFTLIELMIVVAIIAILAAIAMPAYQDYVVRGQVSEGINLATGAKTAIWDFYADKGRFPAENQSAGLADATSINGTYVSSVAVVGGAIRVSFATDKANTHLQSSTLVVSPIASTGSIMWVCKGDTMDPRYLPTVCRNAS